MNSNDAMLQNLMGRSVDELYQAYLAEQSSALAIFMANAKGKAAKATKHEWLEGSMTPTTFTVNAAATIGTFATSGTLKIATAGLEVGSILRFVNGSNKTPVGNIQLVVTATPNSTDATCTIYGGTTDIAIPSGATAVLVSTPRMENEKSFTNPVGFAPVINYNFTQIFRRNLELSRTAIDSVTLGDTAKVKTQLKAVFYKISQEMGEQSIFGRRVQRVGDGSAPGTNGSFAGIDFFIDQSGGTVVDNAAAALTQSVINDAIASVVAKGGMVDTIVCGPKQARAISAFNKSGNNPIITQDSTTAGSYVMRFIGDLPIEGGVVSNIILDPKVASDRIYLINKDKIALVPFNGAELNTVDATVNGQDGVSMLLRGEYTLEVEDAKSTMAIIKNLA